MGIQGDLAEIDFPSLIQAIAQTRRSGKLKLARPKEEGLIVFRHGKVIYAATSSGRETLGSLLLCQGHITEAQLVAALDRQLRVPQETRLGTILVEMGAVPQATVEQVVRDQNKQVLLECLRWGSGTFDFERQELPDNGEVELDTGDFFVDEGLTADHVLAEVAERLDDMEATQPAEEETSVGTEEATLSEEPAPAAAKETPHPSSATRTTSLRSMIREIRSPEFTGEISSKILQFATTLFERGALFACGRGGLRLMSRFDATNDRRDGSPQHFDLLLPADEPSVLSEAAGRKEIVLAHLGEHAGDHRIAKIMKSDGGGEVVAAPLTVNDAVMLVLYGDSLRTEAGEHWREELDLLLLQAGLTIERALLDRRIEHYESLRSRTGSSATLEPSPESQAAESAQS